MKKNQKKTIIQKKNGIKFYSKKDLDFRFPSFCQIIKETSIDSFLISYGEYPPQIRCFDLRNLSLKFERRLDSNIQNFQIISKDWQKILFLRNDRQLEFHTKGGFHYKTKLLTKGTDLLFHSKNNIVYIPSLKDDIYRLDLNEGKFLNSLKNNSIYNNTCAKNSPFGNVLAFGNSGGIVNFWDPRIIRKSILKINGSNFLKKISPKKEITSIRFDEKNEFECLIGFENGEVFLFDIRSKFPIIGKEMETSDSIISIRVNQGSQKILMANSKQIKIWEKKSGKTLKFFESKTQINHLCNIKNSGFFFLAMQKPKIEGKFFSEMGTIPSWISEFEVVSKNEAFHKKIKNPTNQNLIKKQRFKI
jgi:ribosome biogenesis protein ENP2